MFTQRSVFFSRFALIAAMIVVAGTSPVSADTVGITFGSPTQFPLTGPTFVSTSSNVLELPNPLPMPAPTADGFTLADLNYSVQNLTGATISPLDVTWTATRPFSVNNTPVAALLGLDVNLNLSNTTNPLKGSVSGNLTVSVSILEQEDGLPTTVATLSSGAFAIPKSGVATPYSFENSLTTSTLAVGSYVAQIQSDLSISSITGGASVAVDDEYGVGVDAVPEPSSWLQFAILNTIFLAGLARQRWLSRRRGGRAHFAAASPGA